MLALYVIPVIYCSGISSLQEYWLDLYHLSWQVKLLVWFLCALLSLGQSWTVTSQSYCQQQTTRPSVSLLCVQTSEHIGEPN